MFDRLIVSGPAGARIRSRRNYFLVSTLAVVSLALTAVIASIYAEELSLGTDNFELAVLLPPVEMPAAQPPRPRTPAAQAPIAAASQLPTRREPMASVERPELVPKTVSTAANTQRSIPLGSRFTQEKFDSDPVGSDGNGRDTGGNNNGSSGLASDQPVAQHTPDTEPPPARKPEPQRIPPVVTRGVVNGQASYLPKPNYPPAALAVRVQGKVDVQVLIDESGKVVSAKAVSGNALLRSAAENAARSARFTPTTLSDIPVKVTGVIVYNFNLG